MDLGRLRILTTPYLQRETIFYRDVGAQRGVVLKRSLQDDDIVGLNAGNLALLRRRRGRNYQDIIRDQSVDAVDDHLVIVLAGGHGRAYDKRFRAHPDGVTVTAEVVLVARAGAAHQRD
jgi:hypothetical protein